ncbi:HDOD domain-containing protein [Colwellia sp. 4_MG-2023]|uniref:HDOD domain-containing protein n=1 Tax=unclassified Colwellia TaxID=196834 RepID=UPI0026E2BFCD|nr:MULTISPECIES: HDOD domain-containing protein [unclassified Colwellia]MDO6505783.1 HDOD domain-containing protein [Colwellia sp. 5_MG-2023]MDO6554464.1 HDOD domain-containing protein [Colwellia sp. 4_MG-2023]
MSLETVISISILGLLSYFIWRLNNPRRTPKNRGSVTKNNINRKPLLPSRQDDQEHSLEGITNVATKLEFELPEEFLEFELLFAEELTAEQQHTAKNITESFRKPHPLLLPLIQGGFEPSELFDLIKTDAEMTAKILNAVNSPLFSLRQPITNINHAIIFLGITQVKNIATQLAVQQDSHLTDKAQNAAYKKLWTASYLASAFGLILATEMNVENSAELSTHCLLSYLGDLAILSYRPAMADVYLKNYGLFERTKVFQHVIGVNSAVLGKRLAQQWQLPQSIEKGIAYSLLPLANNTADIAISSEELQQVSLCYIACRLADLVAFGGLRNISEYKELSFEVMGKVEFYYTQDIIKMARLDKINTLITDINFRKKINKVIEQAY